MSARQLQVNLLFQANTQAAINNIQQLSATLNQIGTKTTIGVDGGALQRASQSAQELQMHLSQAVNVNTGKLDLTKFNASLNQSKTSLQTHINNLQAVGPTGQQAFLKLATAIASAEAPMLRVNQRLRDFGTTLLNTVKWQLASTAIHSVGSMLSSAVSHAEDLNKALNDIRIVTGKGTAEMYAFTQEATHAARALSTTTTEYAKAALIFYQQGLDGSAVTDRADVVIKLAQVTGQSAETVSSQMTAIWNNFDDGTETLEYYADVLTKLGAATAASTDEISQGLEKFAAVAETVGLSYEYAAASVATVVDKTRQSADVVGTAFKTIFARMEGLSLGETLEDGVDLNKYSEALASVGVNILDTSGQLKSMDTILNELGDKWQYFGQETKVALAQTVGGIRQYNQMLALMENWDAVEDNIMLAKNATGELTKQQSIWSESYEAAAQRVKQAKNELFENFLDDSSIVKLMDMFAGLIDGVTGFIDSLGGVGPMVLMLVAVFNQQLFPLVQRGFITLINNINVLTKKTHYDIMRIQSQTKAQLQAIMEEGNFTAGQKQQLEVTQKLLEAKQKLTIASKSMTEAQRQEAQARMANYEEISRQTQATLEKKAALEEEIRLMKEVMNTGASKRQIAETAVLGRFRDSLPEDSTLDADAVVEDATTTSISHTEAELAALPTDAQNEQRRFEINEKIKSTMQSIADLERNLANTSEQNTERQESTKKKIEEQYAVLQKLADEMESIGEEDVERRKHLQAVLELQKQISAESKKDVSKISAGTMSNKSFGDTAHGRGADVVELEQGLANNVAKSLKTTGKNGKEQAGKVVGSTTAGEDGATQTTVGNVVADASLENLEALYKLMGEYKAQVREVGAMETDLDMAFQEVQAKQQLTDAEGNLVKAKQAAKDAIRDYGKNSAQAKAALEALAKAQKSYDEALVKSKKATNDAKKAGVDSEKVLKSLKSRLQEMYKTIKGSKADKDIKDLDKAFDQLAKGDPGGLTTIKQKLGDLKVALGDAGDSASMMGADMIKALQGAGFDGSQIDEMITKLEKLGIISADAANKMRVLNKSGEDLGIKPVTGAQKVGQSLQTLGSVAGTVAMTFSAAQGTINTFMNPDATGMEKTISLLMTLSTLLPIVGAALTFYNGITAAKQALEEKGIAITGKSIVAQMVEMGVITAKTATTWGNTIANIANLLSNPWTMAIAAVALVAIAAVCISLGAHTAATKENTKAQAEAASGMQESIDKTQELAEEVSALTTKYDELSKSAGNTTDVLTEMEEKIPELIKQYRELADSMSNADGAELNKMADELEHLYNVAQVTGDYSAFEAKQKEMDELITQKEYQNAIIGGQAYGKQAAAAMTEATGGSISGNKMTLNLDGSDASWGTGFWSWLGIGATESEYGVGNDENTKLKDRTDEEKVAKSILKKNAGSYYSGGWSSGMFSKEQADMSVDYTNPAEFVDYYQQLQAAQREMLNTMSESQLADSDIYRELTDALAAGKEHYDQMLPLAQAQADAGGKLAEQYLREQEALSMDKVTDMEQYLAYRQRFVEVATTQYGLTESQAEMYLKESEALSGLNTEYALAEAMLKNFNGATDETIKNLRTDPAAFAEYTNSIKQTLTNAFGELSEEEMQIAVSIAATAESPKEFAEQMQRALIASTRTGLEESAKAASDVMEQAAENGSFNFNSLFADENFLAYLEEIGMQQVELTSASYEEQYKIVSEFYSKVQGDAYETFQVEQNLLATQLADRQRQMAAYHEGMKGDNRQDILDAQAEYADLKAKLAAETDEAKRAAIQNELNALEINFQNEYHFDITSNAQELQNEIDQILSSIEELQNKKIQMAMDWSGVDKVEAGMKKAAEFAKVLEKDTKKVGNSYVMTAAQAREWLEFYPELGEIAETTTDGLISMDADKVDAFMANNDAQLDSSIDTQIKELEAQKETLMAELQAKEIEFEAAKKLKQGELDLENVSAQYLVNMRKNLTDYYIGLGYDEQQANVLALQTMEMNEEEYATRVAELADQQAVDVGDAAEAGANAQVDSLKQLGERWKSFGSFLVNNIGTVLYDIGCALLDPTRSVGDVFSGYWDNTAIAVTPDIEDPIDYDYNTGEYNLTEADLSAAYDNIGQFQMDAVQADIDNLKKAIGSLDGQIDYLNALKNQDLADYGNTDVDDGSDSSGDKDEKDLEEIAERYHEITREVEALERATNRLGEQADRSYGEKRLDLMKDQQKALRDQYNRQKDLLEMQKAFLAIDLDNIKGNFEIEPVIDDDGNISNYTELLQSATDKINEARSAFNESAQTEEDEAALKAAEEAYEKQLEYLEQYEETLDELNDQVDTVTESLYALQDLKFDELNYSLELKIEVNDSDLARIDYYMSKMEGDFYQMAEAAAMLSGSAEAIGQSGSMGVYLSSLEAQQTYLQDLEKAYKNNEISQDAYISGLKNSRDAIYENLTSLQELDSTMMDYYGNTLAMAGEEIAKYTALIDSSASALSYYSSIASLMGKETDYKYMGVILKGQADIAKNSYDIAKAKYDMVKTSADERKAAYDAAVANGAGQEELEMLEKQWWDAQNAVAEAQDTMLSNAEAWASSLRAILDNSLADLGKELENALAEGFGSFDAMNTAFERKNALQEEYLTTTNKIYETNKMMRTAQSEIDKSTNAAAKKRLKQFINETSALQDQTKLSQYELDIQQAKYNLLLAELALEEQQNAKSTVRLQRDNEGNFSYVYTANADKVSEAQQKFEDAQNALYNKGLEGANGYTEKYQQTMQEMYDTLTDLQNQYLEGAFESEEEYQNAIADAKQYYYEKLENYSRLYSIALSTDSQVAADAWTTEFASMTQETGKWMNSVNEYLTGTEKAFADFNSALSTIKNDVVGTNLEDMAENTKAIVDYSNQLAQEVTKEGGVIDALTNEISAVEDITEAYATFRDTLKEIETQYEQIAADADAAVKAAAGLPGVTTGQPGDGNTNEQAPGTTPTSTRDVSNLDWARVDAAYNKISNGDWGAGEEILTSGTNAGYTEDEIETAKELAELIAGGETKESAKTILGFDTGGYTGDWAGSYGKLAFLHKKEMVLRPEDTSNFLASMEILERILQILDLQAVSAQLGGMLTSPTLSHQNDGVLEQNVHIEASFPGVQDHNEIELAISNLVNTASQFANRK